MSNNQDPNGSPINTNTLSSNQIVFNTRPTATNTAVTGGHLSIGTPTGSIYNYIDVDIPMEVQVAQRHSIAGRSHNYDEINDEDVLSSVYQHSSEQNLNNRLADDTYAKGDKVNMLPSSGQKVLYAQTNKQKGTLEDVYHVPQHWRKKEKFALNYDHMTTDNSTYNQLQFSLK